LILSLRLLSAIGASAMFGLMAASLLPYPWLLSAFLLAFAFGTAFMVGTGYRILIAVARRNPAATASASWSGATTGMAVFALLGWGYLSITRGEGPLFLGAFAVALNIAYLPVKGACLLAGCCTAQRRVAGLTIDLRMLEIGVSLALAALAALALAARQPAWAALLGIGGHLALRYASRWARQRLPDNLIFQPDAGQELLPLLVLTLTALSEVLATL
jgi:hypothetical protein